MRARSNQILRLITVLLVVGLVAVAGRSRPWSGGAALHAQQASPPTFRTGANYVRVDVYATANGQAVTDLRADDLDVFEDGQRQTIEQFEYVNVRTAVPAIRPLQPATIAQANLPDADSRARVLVFFLDSAHVDDNSTARVRQPLLNVLKGMVTDADLIALMTPDMSARDITFSHSTVLFEEMLSRDPFWAEGTGRSRRQDPWELQFKQCYGAGPLAQELLARRSARRTMDSLRELVAHLRDVREERKAILFVSNGWPLYLPDRSINERAAREGAGVVQPFTAQGRPLSETGQTSADACESERTTLAAMDQERDFREIVALANRANASFYPIEPRGLDPTITPGIAAQGSRAMVVSGNAQSTLRDFAVSTDGEATINTNKLDMVLRRIMNDLSSYYLLGYQSTGKQDGKYHEISVRTPRPGVSIRARKGYLSAEVMAAPPAAARAAVNETTVATRAALDRLAGAARDMPMRANIASVWPDAKSSPVFVIIGEVSDRAATGTVDATILREDGQPVVTGKAVIAAGSGSVALTIAGSDAMTAGAYVARVRIESGGSSDTLRIPIVLNGAPEGSGALYFRRRGTQDVATADPRFRRTEQVRIELPLRSQDGVTARLLDRNGTALSLPLEPVSRVGDDGARWIAVRPALASLAPGDYIIEIANGATRVLAPFSVVR